jgi:hypothetical protein
MGIEMPKLAKRAAKEAGIKPKFYSFREKQGILKLNWG